MRLTLLRAISWRAHLSASTVRRLSISSHIDGHASSNAASVPPLAFHERLALFLPAAPRLRPSYPQSVLAWRAALPRATSALRPRPLRALLPARPVPSSSPACAPPLRPLVP